MDTSSAAARHSIKITEDDDNFDLDKLLLGDSTTTSISSNKKSPPQSTSASNVDVPALAPILVVEEEGRGDVVGEVITKDDLAPASSSSSSSSSVLRGDAGTANIGNSMHRVPSKSILKKTSSYLAVNDLNTSMSNSMRSVNGGGGILQKASFLSITTMTSNNNNTAMDLSMSTTKSPLRNNRTRVGSVSSYNSQSQDVGLDVDDDSNTTTPRFNFSSAPNSPLLSEAEEGFIQFNNFLKTPSSNDISSTNTAAAAAAAPGAASTVNDASIRSTCSSSSNKNNKLRRNSVSFHSVDVREYDRTVGDNPSCRSGPPISLDWSYSKEYEKNLDEFELERSNERVNHFSKLHMNKYKRQNLLSHEWGHTVDEMKEARRDAQKVQRQRNVTQALLPVLIAGEMLSGVKSFMTKTTRKTKKKKSSSRNGGENDVDSEGLSDLSTSLSNRGQKRFVNSTHTA